MKSKRFVSVIIPTYNRANMVESAIRSVLEQTYSWLEVIVVDDCSTDNTAEVVASINDKRLRYICLETNSGQSAARNRGIYEARYEIIAFQDSDDYWSPNKLERQVQYINDEYKAVYCSFLLSDEYGRTVRVPDRAIPRQKLSGDLYPLLVTRNVVGGPTLIVMKDLLRTIGGFNEQLRANEDWDLVIRLSRLTRFYFLDENLIEVNSNKAGVNHNHKNLVSALLLMLKERTHYNIRQEAVAHLALKECFLTDEHNNTYEELMSILSNSPKLLEEELKKSVKENIVRKNQFDVIKALSERDAFECYLKRNRISGQKVAVYGMGQIGMILVERLKAIGMKVSCMLDHKVEFYKGKTVYNICTAPEWLIENVIITVGDQYSTVERELVRTLNCSCHNIFDIIDECEG